MPVVDPVDWLSRHIFVRQSVIAGKPYEWYRNLETKRLILIGPVKRSIS